jgi:hypothetical protein
MKLQSIDEFISNTESIGNSHYKSLKLAGYYSAYLPFYQGSREIHDWCRDMFNENHYTWTGQTFWFETESDCALFILRWC